VVTGGEPTENKHLSASAGFCGSDKIGILTEITCLNLDDFMGGESALKAFTDMKEALIWLKV